MGHCDISFRDGFQMAIKYVLLALLLTCCSFGGDAACGYNGIDLSPLQGKSFLIHQTLVNVSTDWHFTVCGSNLLHCNESQFNWPPSQAPDRKNFPIGSLVEVYNFNAKYKSCNILGQFRENFISWNSTADNEIVLNMKGGSPAQCRIPNEATNTNVFFVCGKNVIPDDAEIDVYQTSNCANRVTFPTSLVCKNKLN